MNALLSKAAEARKRFAAVKAKGFRRALAEDGAVDLASIMVGILVLGIVAGIIAATVFGVIPWAQNNAASQSLDAVKTAESVFYAEALSAGDTAAYGNKAALITGTNNQGQPLIQDSKKVTVVVANGKYWGVSHSDTGAWFYINSDDPNTVVKAATTAALNTAIGTLAKAGFTFDYTDPAVGIVTTVAAS